MAEVHRYEVRDERRRAALVFLSACPLTEQQVVRAARVYVRLHGVKSGGVTEVDLRIWTADELQLLDMQEP